MTRPSSLPPVLQDCLAAANAGDETAYLACLDPEAVFFGGISGTEQAGHPAILGAFRAGQDLLQRPRFTALRYHGDDREGALAMRYTAAGGSGAALEGLWHLRFGEGGRITRLSLLWNPLALLADPPTGQTLSVSPEVQAVLDAYFATFNAGQDAAHLGLMNPEGVFWGSGSAIQAYAGLEGPSILRAARSLFGIARMSPGTGYGKGLAVGIEGQLHHQDGRLAPCAWVFRLGEDLQLRRLSVLWRPVEFLR